MTYRIMGESWVQLAGNVKCSGLGSGQAFTLPLGYRPASTHRAPAGANPGAVSAVVAISTAGVVTVDPVGGGTFPTNATVSLEGLSFPVDRT